MKQSNFTVVCQLFLQHKRPLLVILLFIEQRTTNL